MAMNGAQYKANIRIGLADTTTFWSNDEIGRAVDRTEYLLDRLIPKKNIVETTITIDRTAEALAISSSAGTTAYKPIKYSSETITRSGTTYVRGTDYTINYITGAIAEIGTQMPDQADYAITYKQDTQRLDISSLVSSPIVIKRVEYPVGNIPPTYLSSFDLIEDYLILHKDTVLTEGKHLRIYYDSSWTHSTTTTVGEYPGHLADIIVVGASGYCLLIKAEKYVQLAITELELVNAAADSMATPLAAIATALNRTEGKVIDAVAALDKVDTYLIDTAGGGVDNAKDVLANITDDIAQLRIRIDAILSKSNDFLFNADTDPSAKFYLTTGDGTIPTINVADRVPEKYADYARASIQIFQGLIQEATIRMNNIQTYVAESQAWMGIGDTFIAEAGQRLGVVNAFIAEAAQRIAEVNAWAIQADRYRATSQEYLSIAGRYLASGQAKINEFYLMLGFKPELAHVQASTSQATKY